MKTIELARILATDLDSDGLIRYIDEQNRLIKNERYYGRTSRQYERFLKAGIQALEMRLKLEKEYD